MNHIELLRQKRISGVITWLMRLLVGATFIDSGFVKAIDPWGTLYKFSEYLSALGLSIDGNLLLVAVFLLFGAEFIAGVFILTGSFRRSASWFAAAIIAFMLPLTLWVAISDPVSDCGCFGDALIISNWATFWKNIVLAAAIAWLVIFNRGSHWLITPALQWLSFIATGAFITAIGLYGYIRQPLIDFRPYPEGAHLYSGERGNDTGKTNIKFIYAKNGVEKEFGIDDQLPDEADGWTFVRRVTGDDHADSEGSTANFHFWDDDENDVTAEVIESSDDHILLLMPDINSVSAATTWQINSLYDWCVKNDISMEAIAAGSEEEINIWKDYSMPSYPIYYADDTLIKELARGNPAVVYLHDGIIRWKSTLSSLNTEDFMAPETTRNPMSFRHDSRRTLTNCTYLYLIIMTLLSALSFVPSLKRMFETKQWQRFTHANRSYKKDDVEQENPTDQS